MPFTDLLRITVFLTGGEATALALITVLSASRHDDGTTLLLALIWWTIATIIGMELGRPRRAADAMREPLASARTATSLPSESESEIARGRLWPIAVSVLLIGGLGILIPSVAMVGAGFALLVSLAWRTREAAVLGIEERDGTRFFVKPGSALKPIELVRTPGLTRDRWGPGHPPPPPAG